MVGFLYLTLGVRINIYKVVSVNYQFHLST